MDNLTRVREASLKVAKVQRRIWLIQTMFWPVVALFGLAVAVAVARTVRRRRSTPPLPPPEPVGLNSASNGNVPG